MPLKNWSNKTLTEEIKVIFKLYKARGFHVYRVKGDQEFKCIENEFLLVEMNIADTEDHVPEVERSIRTVTERIRCFMQGSAQTHDSGSSKERNYDAQSVPGKRWGVINHEPTHNHDGQTKSRFQ